MGNRDGQGTLRIIVFTLYVLTAVSMTESILTVLLFATKHVDSTTLASVSLVLVSSLLSLVYGLLHTLVARRQRIAGSKSLRRTQLYSTTAVIPRFLIVVWMASSGTGLVVAARQPSCLESLGDIENWQMGPSCEIHRATVGMSVVALVISCALFCAVEVASRPFQASFCGVYIAPCNHQFHFGFSPSDRTWSATSAGSLKRQKLYHSQDGDLDLQRDRSVYLQHQNSLSSPALIHLPRPRYSTLPPSSWRCSSMSSVASTIVPPQWPLPSSSRTSSTLSGETLSTFMGPPYVSRGAPRAASSVSSLNHYPSKKSPLSAMRRASEPDVPVIPDRFLSEKPELRRKASLVDIWAPRITQVPLSADPLIRALSTGSPLYDEKSKTTDLTPTLSSQRPTGPSILDPMQDFDLGFLESIGPCPPAIPIRAKGHVPRQSRSDGSLRARTAAAPSTAPTISVPPVPAIPPRVSTSSASSTTTRSSRAPSSLSSHSDQSLTLRKSRSNPAIGRACTTNRQPHPLTSIPNLNYSSTAGSPATAATTYNDYAQAANYATGKHSTMSSSELLEQQRLRARFEQARLREAMEFGMGPWQPRNQSPFMTIPPSLPSLQYMQACKLQQFQKLKHQNQSQITMSSSQSDWDRQQASTKDSDSSAGSNSLTSRSTRSFTSSDSSNWSRPPCPPSRGGSGDSSSTTRSVGTASSGGDSSKLVPSDTSSNIPSPDRKPTRPSMAKCARLIKIGGIPGGLRLVS